MTELSKILVPPTTTIMKVIEIIDDSSMGIAIVIDGNNRLLGTVTDGDIRRSILRGISLNSSINYIMNTKPTIASIYETRESILALMAQKDLKQIPLLDEEGRVEKVELLQNLIQSSPNRNNWVVLMAGGLGKRLGVLTNDCPKPLLPVGNKPILETILKSFTEHGFQRFYITVNYKAEMIEKYFGNGSKFGIEIRYIRESERLGTAGSLSLLKGKIDEPFLVMNGDLLTKVNYNHLLDFHCRNQADATMCVRDYTLQIPYGVVQLDKHRLVDIVEKPSMQYFVSAGIYVLNPNVLDFIPPNCYFDMPTLFGKLIKQKCETVVFPLREYWIDIGQIDDFKQANNDFPEVFNCD